MSIPIRQFSGALYLFSLFLPLSRAGAQNTQLVVQSGTTLTVSNSHFLLNNTDLHCDVYTTSAAVDQTGEDYICALLKGKGLSWDEFR